MVLDVRHNQCDTTQGEPVVIVLLHEITRTQTQAIRSPPLPILNSKHCTSLQGMELYILSRNNFNWKTKSKPITFNNTTRNIKWENLNYILNAQVVKFFLSHSMYKSPIHPAQPNPTQTADYDSQAMAKHFLSFSSLSQNEFNDHHHHHHHHFPNFPLLLFQFSLWTTKSLNTLHFNFNPFHEDCGYKIHSHFTDSILGHYNRSPIRSSANS